MKITNRGKEEDHVQENQHLIGKHQQQVKDKDRKGNKIRHFMPYRKRFKLNLDYYYHTKIILDKKIYI